MLAAAAACSTAASHLTQVLLKHQHASPFHITNKILSIRKRVQCRQSACNQYDEAQRP